jgi:hypothetical protein
MPLAESCGSEELLVKPGGRYRLRFINGGFLLYLTVCFEGHDVS